MGRAPSAVVSLVKVVSCASLFSCATPAPPPAPGATAARRPSTTPSPPTNALASPPLAQEAIDDVVDAGPARATGPYNVVLVSIDSLRAEMPWTGYPRPIAPRLEALEKRATSYTAAYAVSSFTSKSVGGLLAGKYPSELTRTREFFTRYLADNTMFCEVLAASGVPCVGGFAHAYFWKGIAGFDQGFKTWKVVPGIAFDAQTDPYVTSQKLTPLAVELLSDDALTSKPFFAWFHYMDPHDRYQTHDESPKFGTKPHDRYDEEVFYTDLWVGKLLDWVYAQPWAARTVVVVTADHGEAFGEHGLLRHASELYEVLVHVPMFFLVPGQPGRRIAAARSHIDLAPTILDLLGVAPSPTFDGRSFKGELFGAAPDARDVVCDLPQDDFNARHRTLLHGGWKLIAFGPDARYELYDLRADPGESDDRFEKDPERAKEMLARYKDASAKIHEVRAR